MTHRLFVALRPPPEARAALLALMGGVPEARWQTDAQLHATLAFIGEVERHQAEAVAAALARLSAPPLALRFGSFGTFETRGRVSALWIGLEPAEPIAALAARVSSALLPAGVPLPTRRFVAHVTLARFPARGVPPAALLRFLADRQPPALPFRMDEAILFESRLGRSGAHYEPLLAVPLRARAAA